MTTAVYFVSAPGAPSTAEQRGAHSLGVIARLKPHVSRAAAQAEMSTIVSRLNKQYLDIAPRGVDLVPEIDRVAGPARPSATVTSSSSPASNRIKGMADIRPNIRTTSFLG
jgi:hypothetical protein